MNKDRVVLSAGFFNDEEASQLDAIGKRLNAPSGSFGPLTTLQEASIALAPSSDPERRIAIAYTLAAADTEIAPAVEEIVALSASERALLKRIVPAELLFHWEDDCLLPDERGPAVAIFAAIPLNLASADSVRSLVQIMCRDHKDGLIARARDVGYYREAMALSQDESGRPLYLLYLELKVADYATMVSRLLNYPETAFTSWWTPQYINLVGKELMNGTIDRTIVRISAGL